MGSCNNLKLLVLQTLCYNKEQITSQINLTYVLLNADPLPRNMYSPHVFSNSVAKMYAYEYSVIVLETDEERSDTPADERH